MPANQPIELTRLPAAALLRAVAMPDSLQGMAHALPQLRTCIDACHHVWPTTPASVWQSIAIDAQMQLNVYSQSGGDLGSIYTKPTIEMGVYSAFLKWQRPSIPAGVPYTLHALLGRAIVTSAVAHQQISSMLLTGLITLKGALEGKGKRSADWDALAKINLIDPVAVDQFRNKIDYKSPTQNFLAALYHVLQSPILPPSATVPDSKNLDDNGTSPDDETVLPAIQKTRDETKPRDESDDVEDDEDSVPNIGARIKGADYTSFGEKLGLYHRDQLLVDDLVKVTHVLASYQTGTNSLYKGYAALALTSLITGCTDVIALKLEFSPRLTIWLDLEKCCWAWDFQSYRSSHSGAASEWSPKNVEPIYIPLPVELGQMLSRAHEATPTATTLGDLINSISKQPQIDLADFRRFLRGCGSTAHPAYRGRYSRTLSATYLDVTGSDMTSGLMTGRLAATGPAALYYFGPTCQLLTSRVADVYHRLGIGAPAPFPHGYSRVACQKVLEIDVLKAGWQALVVDINSTRQRACSAKRDHDVIALSNKLMTLLASAFVIQTAHRATRLENLTFCMLLTHPSAMLIQDKDEDGHAHPRLIPRTNTVNAILSVALECHHLIHKKLAGIEEKVQSQAGINQPVFVQWTATVGVPAQPISTGDIDQITKRLFEADQNFGRSQWVTYLDEHGCDRWLIRVLTGHTRDVTRTSGTYLDVPPLDAAHRLKAVMERIGPLIFGEQSLNFTEAKYHPPLLQVMPFIGKKRELQNRVLDPRVLLPPISVHTLLGWKATDLVRHKLMSGQINAEPQIQAVLHLIFIDQIPDATLCAIAASNPAEYFRFHAHEQGILWEREHFVHKTWIPIQPTTSALLTQVDLPKSSVLKLMQQTESAIRSVAEISWPRDSHSFWQALGDSTQAWRRLVLAPSLNAMSDPTVPTPCLSANSLRRLAGEQIIVSETIRRSRYASGLGKTHIGDDVKNLSSYLGKYSSSTSRLGEKRQRAIDCLREIRSIQTVWSPMGRWLKDWLVDELECTRGNAPGCYKNSSLLTYLTTLLLAGSNSLQLGDPAEWNEDDWFRWIKTINSRCKKELAFRDRKSDDALSDRAKNALCALVNSLSRRGENAPVDVRSLLGMASNSITACGSASSTLIRIRDSDAAMTLLSLWHQESPTELAMDDIRDFVSSSVPVRTSEISSLFTDCLTPSGGLIIKRAGYDAHKTFSSIRVATLRTSPAADLRSLIQKLKLSVGDQPLLMRCNGSDEMGLRDQRLANDYGDALKFVTGDATARFQSKRSATLQNLCWPGWENLAAAKLQGNANPQQCHDWIKAMQAEWTRTARAATLAGHADLRSAIGNYLAVWPLVYAIAINATLVGLEPGPQFLSQFGLSHAALRQVKSRANRAGNAFSHWAWIFSQLQGKPNNKTGDINAPTLPSNFDENTFPGVADQGSIFVRNESCYLMVRALGLSRDKTLEKLGFPLGRANILDALLNGRLELDDVARRARSDAQPRGQVANIELALSGKGAAIVEWMSQLTPNVMLQLHRALFRQKINSDSSASEPDFWVAIADGMPRYLSLHLRLGSKVANGKTLAGFSRFSDMISVSIDRKIGSSPVISIHLRGQENRVASSRLSAVVRAASLAIAILIERKRNPNAN